MQPLTVREPNTLLIAHGEHTRRGEVWEHVGQRDRPLERPAGRAAGEKRPAALEVRRLVHKVELERQVWRELVEDPAEMEVVWEEPRDGAHGEADGSHVARRGLAQPRVLHLHRELPAAPALHRAVHLRQARRCDRLRLKRRKQLAWRSAKLRLDDCGNGLGGGARCVLKQRGQRLRVSRRHDVVALCDVLAKLDVHAAVGPAELEHPLCTPLVQRRPSLCKAVVAPHAKRCERFAHCRRGVARPASFRLRCSRLRWVRLGSHPLCTASLHLHLEMLLRKRLDFGTLLNTPAFCAPVVPCDDGDAYRKAARAHGRLHVTPHAIWSLRLSSKPNPATKSYQRKRSWHRWSKQKSAPHS